MKANDDNVDDSNYSKNKDEWHCCHGEVGGFCGNGGKAGYDV